MRDPGKHGQAVAPAQMFLQLIRPYRCELGVVGEVVDGLRTARVEQRRNLWTVEVEVHEQRPRASGEADGKSDRYRRRAVGASREDPQGRHLGPSASRQLLLGRAR